MSKVQTIFSVNGEGFTVEGVGQETVKAALTHSKKNFNNKPVKIIGFIINDKQIGVNLKVHPRNILALSA